MHAFDNYAQLTCDSEVCQYIASYKNEHIEYATLESFESFYYQQNIFSKE